VSISRLREREREENGKLTSAKISNGIFDNSFESYTDPSLFSSSSTAFCDFLDLFFEHSEREREIMNQQNYDLNPREAVDRLTSSL